MLTEGDIDSVIHKLAEHDLQVTSDEVLEYHEAFSEFDRDKNQNISTSELGCVMRSLGENPTSMELEAIINEFDEDGNGTIEFPEFSIMMARKAKDQQQKEHLHWQETFRVFTTPREYPKTPKELQEEHPIVERVLPIDEFRYVMSSLNISSRRIVDASTVDEMIAAVDDGDGKLDFKEFVELIQKRC
ncbi:hypothetical protein TCAL_04687 [Tigriopus californicus]|uniref:EF-hand domain-containing protein n=1 Tax=Tigriopus californicus TaxID=6832 RepID=A0A553NSN9_TIGCA|nr:neo-calmodulin-like [Tigriopus californicus]TRY68451.1 hypothetical protein TCAL_04687 [Tigriopus californicus]